MSDLEEHDPFDDFNRAVGAGRVRDPYPEMAERRRNGPVQEISFREITEQTNRANDITPPDSLKIFGVLTHEAVSQVLLDGATFSSSGYAASMGIVMGRTILQMDEPEHSRYRGLIQMAFTRKALARWETELVGPVVHGLIDEFSNGAADLVRELTFPFPVSVIAGMIGLPDEDVPRFHRKAVELISVGFDFQRGVAASQALADIFRPVLEKRRAQPGDDLISVLAHAEVDGTRLTDDEIFAFLRLLAPAGAETTYRSSSNLLFGLLTHPEQLAALRADRSLMAQAIEEGLRWEAPLTGIMRVSTRDAEVCGHLIPAGSVVYANIGSANRDESRYENPDAFDIFREPKQHLAFAYGPHRCLGMHLARMETSVALNALLDRLPNLRLDPAWEDPHITGQGFRSPPKLPVLFDA